MMRAAAVFVTAMLAADDAAGDMGSIAPAFELPGPAGTMKLADFRGKPVYIDFWASWCGPCRQSFPWMNALPARFSAHGLQVIGINLDTKEEDARRFLAATPARFTVVFDPAGTTPRSYGIKGMPSSVLIGPDGRILMTHTGFRESDKAMLESRIAAALEGTAK